MVLRFGTMCGVNYPVVFLINVNSRYNRFISYFLSDYFIFSEGYYVIMNKNSYMDDVALDKVSEILNSHILKIMISAFHSK